MNKKYIVHDKKTVILADFFDYFRGKRLKKSDRVPGNVPLVTAGYQNEGIAEYISNTLDTFENALTIDMFGNCFWRPYVFACDDNIIVLKSSQLNTNTAHFYLSAIKKSIGVFHYNNQYRLEDLRKHQMDLPIINDELNKEVISNISEILTSISKLEAELEAELEARTKQYEFYRNKILDFSSGFVGIPKIDKMLAEMCPDGVQMQLITKVFNFRNGYTPSKAKPEFWEYGTVPWFRMEDIRINGSILSDAIQKVTLLGAKNKPFPKNSIIVGTTATIGVHALITVESLANQQFTYLMLNEEFRNKVNMKYFYYYMYLIDEWLKKSVTKCGFAIVNTKNFKKLEIPIPPLEVQNEIVRILDNFSEYVTSISQGLPAEITARRKQYEYYRNKLLTF